MSEEVFSQAISDRICNHMNKDHADSVLVYAKSYGNLTEATAAQMLTIDAEGMNLSAQVGEQSVPLRIPFAPALKDAKDAHTRLVDLLKQVPQDA